MKFRVFSASLSFPVSSCPVPSRLLPLLSLACPRPVTIQEFKQLPKQTLSTSFVACLCTCVWFSTSHSKLYTDTVPLGSICCLIGKFWLWVWELPDAGAKPPVGQEGTTVQAATAGSQSQLSWKTVYLLFSLDSRLTQLSAGPATWKVRHWQSEKKT